MDKAKCELCEKEFVMVHNEDEDNSAQIDSIEETGRCLDCIDEFGEDGYPNK